MYFGKEVKVLLKGQAKEKYLELSTKDDKEAKTILESIKRVADILKENPQYGDPINKRLFPKEFVKAGIKNLYRVELSNYWRMLYTIQGNEIDILLFVLSISDHKEYNKIFGYK